MKQFKRFRSLDELKSECEKRNWKLDSRRHDEDGHDYVRFEFKVKTLGKPVKGFVLFNTFNGRFFGERTNGEKFDGAKSTHDGCRWFQILLDVMYTNEEGGAK